MRSIFPHPPNAHVNADAFFVAIVRLCPLPPSAHIEMGAPMPFAPHISHSQMHLADLGLERAKRGCNQQLLDVSSQIFVQVPRLLT
jgi:hypothetical protein